MFQMEKFSLLIKNSSKSIISSAHKLIIFCGINNTFIGNATKQKVIFQANTLVSIKKLLAISSNYNNKLYLCIIKSI